MSRRDWHDNPHGIHQRTLDKANEKPTAPSSGEQPARAPECTERCQYAQDISMPEYSCAGVCQYATLGNNFGEQPVAPTPPCEICKTLIDTSVPSVFIGGRGHLHYGCYRTEAAAPSSDGTRPTKAEREIREMGSNCCFSMRRDRQCTRIPGHSGYHEHGTLQWSADMETGMADRPTADGKRLSREERARAVAFARDVIADRNAGSVEYAVAVETLAYESSLAPRIANVLPPNDLPTLLPPQT